MITCRVRCIRLLDIAIRSDCVIQAHCSIMNVSCVLHLPLRYLALERLGIETSRTLEGSSRVLMVVNSVFLLARVESLIHVSDVLLDTYSLCCAVIILAIDLSGWMTLGNARIVCNVTRILLMQMRSNAFCVKGLQCHLVASIRILNLTCVLRSYGFGWKRNNIGHSFLNGVVPCWKMVCVDRAASITANILAVVSTRQYSWSPLRPCVRCTEQLLSRIKTHFKSS